MSFKMAELDRFPGHRMEDGGARKRGGILRSTQCVCVCVCVCVWVGGQRVRVQWCMGKKTGGGES